MRFDQNSIINKSFANLLKKKTLLIIIILNTLLAIFAINGHITSNTTWNEDLTVTGDLWIDENVTLTIAAGVTITIPKIDQDADGVGDIDINVSGRMIALGSASQKVVFQSLESSPSHKDWAGINFTSSSSQSQSNLTHVEIYNANRAIYIDGIGIQANNLKIINSEEYGVKIDNTINMTRFIDTIIENTSQNGMFIESGSVNMTDLSIGNSGNLGLKADSPVTIAGTRVNVARSGSHGLWLDNTQTVTFTDSRFNSNSGNGILIENMSPSFNNCQVNNNNGAGVRISSTNGVPSFNNTTISSNLFGVSISSVPAEFTYCNIEDNRFGGISIFRAEPSITYSNITNNGYEIASYDYDTEDEYEWRTTSGSTTMPLDLYEKLNPAYAPMYIERITYKKDGDNYYCSTSSSSYRYYRNYTRFEANDSNYLVDEFTYYFSSYYTYYDMSTQTVSGDINELISNRTDLVLNMYNTQNVPNPRAWISNIKYNLNYFVSVVNLANTSAILQNNWWGQVTGIDSLVAQDLAGTANYEGAMVSRITEAGCDLINTPASISLTSPMSLEINPTSTTISWIASDYDDNAQISLFYNSVNDENGTLITNNLQEDNDFSYEWDFTDTPYGKYYIYAIIDDGVNSPVTSFAPGQVMVGELKVVIDDYYASAGDTISVSLQALNAYENFDLNSFQITIGFTPSLLTYLETSTEACLTQDWTVNTNGQIMGEVAVNGFSVDNLNGSGDLFQLKFLVNESGQDLQNTDITINNFQYNNGSPEPTIESGLFTLRNVYDVSGWTNYYSNNGPIPDVNVTALGFSQGQTTSNDSGEFLFNDYYYGDYNLTAEFAGTLSEMLISPLDASMVARYALGLINLDGNQIVAGNVDGDGDVDIYDAGQIARYSVGMVTEFPAGQMVFTPENHEFLLSPAFTPRTFMGIAIGDVSGNWENTRDNTISECVTYQTYEDEDFIFLDIAISESFYALASKVAYNPETLEFVEFITPDSQNGLTSFANGQAGLLKTASYSVNLQDPTESIIAKFRKLNGADLSHLQVLSLVVDENNSTITSNNNEVTQASGQVYQNYPNPFNPRTTISFYNAKEQRVKIDIYNLKGQKVTSLLDNELTSGRHNISWNAEELSSGIYFTKIKMADGYQKTIKMILMK
jgi:hypothetical protein